MSVVRLDQGATGSPKAVQAAWRDRARDPVPARDASAARTPFRLDHAEAARSAPDQARQDARTARDTGSERRSVSARDASPRPARTAAAPGKPAADRSSTTKTAEAEEADGGDSAAPEASTSTQAVSTAESVAKAVEAGAETPADAVAASPPSPIVVAPPAPAAPPPPPAVAVDGSPSLAAAATGARFPEQVADVATAKGGTEPGSIEGSNPDAAADGPEFAAVLGSPLEAGPAPGAASPAANAPVARSAEPAAATAPAQPSAPPVPLGAVPMTIALRSLQDTNRFEIRLDPVDLGRIDVRLDIDKDGGTVSADLVVDRPATLALLQRDAAALQQALSQTGFDASGGISLSLRDGTASDGRHSGNGAAHGQHGPAQATPFADTTDVTDLAPTRLLRLSGIDIRI